MTVADVVCFQVARMRGARIRRRQPEGVRRHLTAGEAVTTVAQRPYRRIQETVHRQVLQALTTKQKSLFNNFAGLLSVLCELVVNL
jgi:hypothetical protein